MTLLDREFCRLPLSRTNYIFRGLFFALLILVLLFSIVSSDLFVHEKLSENLIPVLFLR
jgi:hypothetical protein